MAVLQDLSPAKVFYYFEELANIPHGSFDTKAVTDYLTQFASERGLTHRADDYGNVVIFADGTEGYESAKPVILQGHMDMVAVKRPESAHDFKKDPLKLVIDGDEIYAEGTSLGGDDGVAVAYMLAILDDPTIPHPPLDCIFTTDEEVGMLGAEAFDAKDIRGKRMINLDSEEEGVFTCGCAGGARVDTVLPIKRATVKGLPVVVTFDGLNGGHSGSMIATGRASANKLIARFLYALQDHAEFSLEKVSGGEKDNAIAISSKAHLVTDEEEYEAIEAFAKTFETNIRQEMQGIDEGFSVHIAKGEVRSIPVLDMVSQEKAMFLMLHAPQGVRKMNGLIPDMTETSSNLGILRTTDTEFVCGTLVRSAISSAKEALIQEIRSLAESQGAQLKISGNYPEWPYKDNSKLKAKMTAIYEQMYGEAPKIEIVHGGVECGVFGSKIKGLDAVSVGPDMKEIHTFEERLSITSTKRTWEFLLKVLEELK